MHPDADDDKLSARAQSGNDRTDGFPVGHRRQDGFRAAQLAQFSGDILCQAVQVDMRAELAHERLLIGTTCGSDGTKTHLGSKLDAEMAEAADAEDRDEIAGRAPLSRSAL